MTQQEALAELVRAAAEAEAALVLITHEEGIARAVADRAMHVGTA